MSSAPLARPLSCASNNTSGTHPSWSPPMTGERMRRVWGSPWTPMRTGKWVCPSDTPAQRRSGKEITCLPLLPTSCYSAVSCGHQEGLSRPCLSAAGAALPSCACGGTVVWDPHATTLPRLGGLFCSQLPHFWPSPLSCPFIFSCLFSCP